MGRSILLSAVLTVVGLFSGRVSQVQAEETKGIQATGSIYDFSMKRLDGAMESLSAYKGKVVLIVNTASKCGLTPQYEGLEKLYETYGPKGFVVLGFPANNFLWQEPGSDPEIAAFCSSKYNVTFPMFSKISVKGADKHPLYVYLTERSPFPGEIKWNFQKYLIGRNGYLIAQFDPKVTPEDPKIVAAIEAALAGPVSAAGK
ncbi:MAG: glutathione peroxidase [Myxococcales bacterium]|nr:MAG: glutathione peroxidase [Myxococcales bacterium]